MEKTYKAEIIGVGTELLLGQIANTNAQWISDKLADIGLSVYYHQVVGDNLARVERCFDEAKGRSDIVFVTGGLGPTEDDLTREAFASLTGELLELNEDVLTTIHHYFSKNNRQVTANNRKQAMVFPDATIIDNHIGTAPGMIVSYEQTMFIFMPGVPREMKQMMTEFVIPYLKDQLSLEEVISSRMLRFIGIGEAQLETKIQSIVSDQVNPTVAPLASDGEVAVRITAKANTADQANQMIEQKQQEVLAIVGSYYYGYDDVSIETAVLNLLIEKKQTLAAAESLTGGLFADALVSLSGASQVFQGSVVSYSEHVKQAVLNIPRELLVTNGTVSKACAKAMAEQVAKTMRADIAISFTGVAGPNALEGQPPGTVYISIYQANSVIITEKYHFYGDRNYVRKRSVKKGLELLYYLLKNNKL
ncbi:putative competence-damage inducible protein [Paraliobacillus ryukyuensis]|uniref:Putative competence-damage inducible protein n=1 Tax=Paraliobacillus ryukyuensis TaxID=200904 RepID=A0A366EJ29_9BACI|nr:competence/damage-inducible protein A [Paraliobacillus ryukyuensis]RBP01730.1 competence/damage-inducible protein cinA [Paraliobacillus ryukyuensis]